MKQLLAALLALALYGCTYVDVQTGDVRVGLVMECGGEDGR